MNPQNVTPDETYPNWIRLAKRGTDWGILLVFVLSIACGWSFIVYDGLNPTNASENYTFLVADLSQSLREGQFYPRWSAHAFGGIGAPIPHFLPPVPTYLTALIGTLFTDDSIQALRITFLMSFVIGGLSVYSLVTRHVHARAGIVASVLFLYSPSVGYLIPHYHGNLHEMFALALLAMWLWATDRLLAENNTFDFSVHALVSGLLVLTSFTHLLMALLLGASLLTMRSRKQALQQSAVIGLSVLLGAMMTAFYWLPALLDGLTVHWLMPTKTYQNAITLPNLFKPFISPDPQAMIALPQTPLGVAIISFAILSGGILGYLRIFNLQTKMLLFGLALVGLTVFVGAQFGELLGVMVLCFAIGGSGILQATSLLTLARARILFVVSATVAILITLNISTAYRPNSITPQPTLLTQIRYEQQGLGVAVAPPNFAIPSIYLPSQFDPSNALLAGYQTQNLNRLQANVNLSNQISVLSVQSHRQSYQVSLRDTVNITAVIADFEGWEATLNNNPVNLEKNLSTYGMEFLLPARASGDLIIQLVDTPLWDFAWVVSLVGLLLALFILWSNRKRPYTPHFSYRRLLSIPDTRLISVAIGMLATLAIIVYVGEWSLRPIRGSGLLQTTELSASTNVGLELVSYTLEPKQAKPSDALSIGLYWRTRRLLSENYLAYWALSDVQRGQSIVVSEAKQLGNYPSRRWQRDVYVIDAHTLVLPSNLPQGRYTLTLYVYSCVSQTTCEQQKNVTFFNESGNSVGASFTLPRLLVIN